MLLKNNRSEAELIFQAYTDQIDKPTFFFDEKLELCQSIIDTGKQIDVFKKLFGETEEEISKIADSNWSKSRFIFNYL